MVDSSVSDCYPKRSTRGERRVRTNELWQSRFDQSTSKLSELRTLPSAVEKIGFRMQPVQQDLEYSKSQGSVQYYGLPVVPWYQSAPQVCSIASRTVTENVDPHRVPLSTIECAVQCDVGVQECKPNQVNSSIVGKSDFACQTDYVKCAEQVVHDIGVSDSRSLWQILDDLAEEPPPSTKEVILNVQGLWQQFENSECLDIGDVIQLGSPTTSLNAFAVGLQGFVERTDDDGDMYICFPSLQDSNRGAHWIGNKDAKHMRMRRSLCNCLDGFCKFWSGEDCSLVLQVGNEMFVNGWRCSELSPQTVRWSMEGEPCIIWWTVAQPEQKTQCCDESGSPPPTENDLLLPPPIHHPLNGLIVRYPCLSQRRLSNMLGELPESRCSW